jgi:8-oxo-dGTP diphosphatase
MVERPKVGVGVIIVKDKRVLLSKRINQTGHGTWHFPGGHLEFGEEIEACASREALEEAGIKIKNPKIVAVTNNIYDTNTHYVVIFVLSEHESGEPKIMEPNKSKEWQWFEWGKLPRPLFLPVDNLIKQGFNPF